MSISVIIPCFNEERILADCLAQFEDCPDIQVIVSDGGSTDDSLKIASSFTCDLIRGEKGRAKQMNHGVSIAKGELLVFLHADTQLSLEVLESFRDAINKTQWGFCAVGLDSTDFAYKVIAWFINKRSRLTKVATGDQVIFIKKAIFDSLGGFPAIPLMEDVAMSKKLRAVSAPLVVKEKVISSARKWREKGLVRVVLLMWWIRFCYFIGVGPHTLHSWYYGKDEG